MTVTSIPEGGTQTPADGKTPSRSRKRLLVALLVLALLGGSAWWYLVMRPASAQKGPEPGDVMSLEPIQVNLAGGHYLKLGLALQESASVSDPVDGSKALDSAITLFSGLPVQKVVRPESRARLKQQLVDRLEQRYDGEVFDVYFTDFVTQ